MFIVHFLVYLLFHVFANGIDAREFSTNEIRPGYVAFYEPTEWALSSMLPNREQFKISPIELGGHREARPDPAWRHIGLGKRSLSTMEEFNKRSRMHSPNNERTWAMIGLGRRRR